MTSQRPPGDFPVTIEGRTYRPAKGYWKTGEPGMQRLNWARRISALGNTVCYIRYIDDFPVFPMSNMWDDTVTSGFSDKKVYVVQTGTLIFERCLLMTTDPGDLVLDPTCGSGTTAYVAEQWGRRWIDHLPLLARRAVRDHSLSAVELLDFLPGQAEADQVFAETVRVVGVLLLLAAGGEED